MTCGSELRSGIALTLPAQPTLLLEPSADPPHPPENRGKPGPTGRASLVILMIAKDFCRRATMILHTMTARTQQHAPRPAPGRGPPHRPTRPTGRTRHRTTQPNGKATLFMIILMIMGSLLLTHAQQSSHDLQKRSRSSQPKET